MYPNPSGGFLKGGLSFLKNIDFAGFLDGTSKTLSVINQAIPVYHQVKPIISNLRTITQLSNVINEEDPIVDSALEENTQHSSIFYI